MRRPDTLARRHFLLSAAGLLTVAASRRVSAQAAPIVVVGAGVAGLRAADRLRSSGHRVIILEARARPGGRVVTVREPLSEGLYCEAGPIRISSQHRRLLEVVSRFGLPLIPFASGSGDPLAVARGVRARPSEMERIGRALDVPRGDLGLTQGQLLERYVGELPPSMSDPEVMFAEDWRPFDLMAWPAWLRTRGASEGSITLMTLGGDSRDLSALYVLRQYALLRAGGLYKIEGGMDRLTAAMASVVAPVIEYGAQVTRLEPGPAGVTVDYVSGGRARTVTSSRVIVTVPASVFSRIRTASPDLRRRMALAGEVAFFPATRFMVEASRRSWHDDALSGAARTDRPAEVWDAAYEVGSEGGVLGATVGGTFGRALARQSRSDALAVGIDVVRHAFPGVPVRRATAYRWALDPWVRGAFATFGPGQMSRIAPSIGAAIGRIHFAGEHTAPWMGWMEGALQSADRVVEEVLS